LGLRTLLKWFIGIEKGKWTGNGEYSNSGGEYDAVYCMAYAGYAAVFPAAEHGFLPAALVRNRRTAHNADWMILVFIKC
jgi:hypothetical protein